MQTVLHVEDDPLWIDVIQHILRSLPAVTLCGTVTKASLVLEACERLKPETVILDLRLPDGDGTEVISGMQSLYPVPKIILFTVRADDAAIYTASSLHVTAMVWKNTGCVEHISEALLACANGRRYFPVEVREAIDRIKADPIAFFKILSRKEIALVKEFAQGHSDSQIAVNHKISPETAHSHRSHILRKLGIHRTIDLIWWALRKGLIDMYTTVPPTKRMSIYNNHLVALVGKKVGCKISNDRP